MSLFVYQSEATKEEDAVRIALIPEPPDPSSNPPPEHLWRDLPRWARPWCIEVQRHTADAPRAMGGVPLTRPGRLAATGVQGPGTHGPVES